MVSSKNVPYMIEYLIDTIVIYFLMSIRKINKFYTLVKEHIKKLYYLHLIYTFSITINENGTVL
jgi:hypothetical protein